MDANLWAALGNGQSQSQAAATADATVLAGNQNFHNMGRSVADQGRPAAGSDQFNHLFDSVRTSLFRKKVDFL